jgi:hypothetical protein
MSWWIYKKNKDGKVHLIAADVPLLSAMMLVALIAALFYPFLIRLNPKAMIQFFFLAGFLCLLAAKVSLFKRGIWFSWGPGQMTQLCAWVYKIGYTLMGIGALMTIAAYRATH